MKRSNLLTKCIAIMLTFTMMAGLVNVPAITTEAKSGDKITISLSDINWNGDSYKFGTVNANITSGTQHILCIKVSKGSFNIGSNLGTNMSGIKYNPDNNETEDDYTSAPTTSDKLKLLTVKGDFSAEQVVSFIKNITFNREGIADDAEQKVNVIASEIKLGPNETAMVLEDKLHIYRYVNWKDSTYRSDVDNTDKYTYFTAYNEAKAAQHEGLNGYLATITEDYEHDFIYNDVSKKSSWVGGARTFTNGTKFTNGEALDADTISEAAIVPGTASRELGKQCLDWLWICGPEAGDVFYRLNSSQQGAGEGNVPDEKYANWNPGEPNNTWIETDTYRQEYCLEYGFGSDHGKWNDWDPKVTLRNLYDIDSQWSVSGYIVEFSPYESKTTNKTYKFDDNYTPVSEVVIVKKSGKIIEANDYSISLADAKNSTKDSVITKSEALVTSGGVKDNSAVITLSDADLNKIKNAKAGDVVEVTLTSDGATPKTVKVTVTGENPSITAHDFFISKTDAASVNDSKVRDLSDAKGTKTDGSNSDPITVDSDSINNIKNAKVGDSVDVKLTNPDAIEKTTTVKATVFDVVTDNTGGTGAAKDEMIGGNGYTVNAGGTPETVNSVITKSAAKALDKDGKAINPSNLIVNPEDLAKLNEAINAKKETVVNVRISTPNGTTATIPVTVKVENPSISAHDFLISKTDAASVNDDKVRNLSDATGTKANGDPSGAIIVDQSAINNIKNAGVGATVDVKLTNPDAPIKTTTVKAKVFDIVTDNTGGSGAAKDEMIGGNGYTVPKGKTSQSASDVLNNGAVTAIDPQGNPITLNDGSVNTEDLKKLNDAIKAGKDTVVDVTVSTPNGTSVKIPVTVKGEVVFPNITANDFFISKTDAAKITDTVAKSNSNATVYDKNGKAVSNPAISIDNLNSVKTTASGNSTTITFKSNVDGKDVTDTAIVTVFDNANNGKGSDGSVVSIGANNFVLTVEQASNPASALQSLAKQLSGVKALDDDDAVNISSINADVSNIKPVENLDGYDVTFEYMGVKTTVKAIVKDTSVKKDTITAQSFFISKTDATTCDDDKTKYYSHVSAKDPKGNPIADEKIKVSGTSDIKKANAGDIVPVSFSTDTATTNVSAKVFDSAHNGTGNSGKHVSIGANDYELTIAQAGNTSTLDSVSKSLAKVAALSKGANVDVNSIAIDTSKIKAEAGVYDVTFSYDGAVITVKATVKDGDALSPSGDANKVTVTANDKEVVRGTDPLTKKQLLDYINATGITDLGENVDVTVSDEDIKKFNDALKDPSVPSIKITVTDNNGNSTDVTITFKDADGTVGQDKVFEISNPTDVIEIVDKNKKVTAVTVDGTPIPTDSYTVTDDKLIIDDDFFKKYDPDTSHKVVVTYDDGTDMDFNVYIIEYNDDTVSKIVPVMNMVKEIIKGQKFKLNLKGIASNCSKIYQSDNKKVATISKKGVIKGKKYGTAHVNAYVIQNGSYYKVEVTVKVKKKSKRIGKNYNLKKKAVVSVGSNLPEFNVYKRVYKKKKTTLSFKDVQVESADAISFYIPKKYKKEKKNIKIGKVKYDAENGVASCKIKGLKKGFTHLTCRIEQNDQVYYTRIFVRVDDGTKNKKLKTYLK